MSELRVDDLNPRAGDELLKSFFENAAVGLSITDLQGRFVKVNAAYCALTGYTEAELNARDFQSITHPDDLPRTLAKVESLLSGKISSFLIEKRYIRKDAIIVWALNSVSVIRDKHGRPLNLVRLSQDITEQVGLDESLRQAELQTQLILANITDVYLQFDYQWRYTYVNEAAVRAIGRPRELILGRTLWEVFPDIIGTDLEHEYHRAMDDRVTVNCDFYYSARNNWWENRFYPVPAGLAVFATDITERRRSVQAIVEAERKYRDIFENAGEGIFQSTQDGQYIAANPALARMHGFDSPEELLSDRDDIPHQVYVDPERREEFKRLLGEHSVVRGFEHQIFRKDGSKIWISVNARAVRDEQGRIVYYEGTAHDITARKHAEQVENELHQRIRDVLENINDGFVALDRDWRYTYVNRRAGEMLERRPEDLIGKNVWTEFPESVGSSQYRACQRVMHQRRSLEVEDHYFSPLGRWYHSFIYPTPDGLAVCLSDVTEQRLAEQALRESEEHCRDLVENSSELICTHDLNGLVLSANPAAAAAVGYDLDEFVGKKSVRDILAPEVRDQFDGYMTRLRKCGATTGIMNVQTKSGERRIWEYHNSMRTEGVATPIVRGMARDITEERSAQKELRESEERFSKAFYSSPVPLIITRSVDGCFLNANDSFLSTFGYERDEVIGKTVRDLNLYVDQHGRKKLIDELREQGALRGYESRARTKSGRILDLLVFVEPIKLKGEQCLLSTAYDITERKSIEEALRESEERYRELFENAKDALYVHDLGGRYTSFNRAAEELSGFSREEILGKHFSNFVAPASLRSVRENLCKKLDDEGVTTYEIDLITKDRRRVPVEVSSRLIYENGKPIGVQGVARDMTERKRAQEALRTYSQRLIEAQEAERQVIARELHDEIGQVLTAVRINLQSLQHSTHTGSQRSSIEDSLVIVDEALDRVRELSLNLRPSVLDNLGLSSALRWYVDRYARRSGIVADLQSDLEDGRRLGVELETACFRIVQEALTNVVRHARATRVLVRLKRANGNLTIKVMDDGVGFDVAGLIKNSPLGWNLGLRGMEERAVAAQGRLKINSAPMRGTEISVSFPLKEER